jgi:hypothetical protein
LALQNAELIEKRRKMQEEMATWNLNELGDEEEEKKKKKPSGASGGAGGKKRKEKEMMIEGMTNEEIAALEDGGKKVSGLLRGFLRSDILMISTCSGRRRNRRQR